MLFRSLEGNFHPREFIFDQLDFRVARMEITPESPPAVAELLDILQAYPEFKIRLAGTIRALVLEQDKAAARVEQMATATPNPATTPK